MRKKINWNKTTKILNAIKIICIIAILVMTIVHYQTDKTELRQEGFDIGVQTMNQALMQQLSQEGFIPLTVGNQTYKLVIAQPVEE